MAKQFIGILLTAFLCWPAAAFQEIQISFRAVPDRPFFVGQPEINIDAEEFTTVVIPLKSSRSGSARLFWASSYDPQMNELKSVWFFLKKSAGFRDYVFNLKSQNPYWAGFIGQLLIYPDSEPAGLEIGLAKAIPGNFLTTMKSGWQEFWGPRGRLVIGSTINTIQSSNLFGRPIYIYIYWIIGLWTVGFWGWKIHQWSSLKKRPAFETTWLNTGKSAFIVVIVFWGLLEISSLFTNWLAFKDDLKYFGKSYRNKLVLANPGDFYPFIEFCAANLTADAEFDFRIQPIYGDIKTKYYLYPRKFKKEAEYLIVYDTDVEKETAGKYVLWETFRHKAYIMRKN